MLGIVQSASFDPIKQLASITLASSLSLGQTMTVEQYCTAGDISLPAQGQYVQLEQDGLTSVRIVGYLNTLVDKNFVIVSGEWSKCNANWYLQGRLSGLQIQQALTDNIEHLMAGESTNAVLLDLINNVIALCAYTSSHIHTNGNAGANTGTPTTSVQPTNLSADKSYIGGNQNLIITGTYKPK